MNVQQNSRRWVKRVTSSRSHGGHTFMAQNPLKCSKIKKNTCPFNFTGTDQRKGNSGRCDFNERFDGAVVDATFSDPGHLRKAVGRKNG